MINKFEITINDIDSITTENDNICIILKDNHVLTFSISAIDHIISKTLPFIKELADKYTKEINKKIAIKKALEIIKKVNKEMTDPDLTMEEQFKFLWRLAFVDLQFLEEYREP